MKKPNQCPDNTFVENEIFRLIKRQVESENLAAFSSGSTLRYVDRRATAKSIAHYEIYKIIDQLPEHIVELGVFKGESLLRFAQFSEIFQPYDRSFDIIGFDNFCGFPEFNSNDGIQEKSDNKTVGGWSS